MITIEVCGRFFDFGVGALSIGFQMEEMTEAVSLALKGDDWRLVAFRQDTYELGTLETYAESLADENLLSAGELDKVRYRVAKRAARIVNSYLKENGKQ